MAELNEFVDQSVSESIQESACAIAKKAFDGEIGAYHVIDEINAFPEEKRVAVAIIFATNFLSNCGILDPGAVGFTTGIAGVSIADSEGVGEAYRAKMDAEEAERKESDPDTDEEDSD